MTTLRKPSGGLNLKKASAGHYPKQFEVWVCDQENSRRDSIPPVPSDPMKEYRPFIVISTNEFNSGGNQVVCLPLSRSSYMKIYEVKLDANEAGNPEVSYIKCF